MQIRVQAFLGLVLNGSQRLPHRRMPLSERRPNPLAVRVAAAAEQAESSTRR